MHPGDTRVTNAIMGLMEKSAAEIIWYNQFEEICVFVNH